MLWSIVVPTDKMGLTALDPTCFADSWIDSRYVQLQSQSDTPLRRLNPNHGDSNAPP